MKPKNERRVKKVTYDMRILFELQRNWPFTKVQELSKTCRQRHGKKSG
jgi:hypothetical protein